MGTSYPTRPELRCALRAYLNGIFPVGATVADIKRFRVPGPKRERSGNVLLHECIEALEQRFNVPFISREAVRYEALRMFKQGLLTGAAGAAISGEGLLPFGGTQPPSFAATLGGVTFDNANAAWQWDSPDTILGPPAAPPANSLGVNVWESFDPQFLGQCAGDRLATRPAPDNAQFGVRPLYVSIGGDTGRSSISAAWGGLGVRNVAGQEDFALFENGSAPPNGEEGFAVAVHHQERNAWSGSWFKEPFGYEAPYTFSFVYDLTDFGIPVGEHVDAILFQNVVRGDRTTDVACGGDAGVDGYGFLLELGDGTGPIYLTGLTGAPLAASKCDPDVNYVVALSPLE